VGSAVAVATRDHGRRSGRHRGGYSLSCTHLLRSEQDVGDLPLFGEKTSLFLEALAYQIELLVDELRAGSERCIA
jgi:hypothetical protein